MTHNFDLHAAYRELDLWHGLREATSFSPTMPSFEQWQREIAERMSANLATVPPDLFKDALSAVGVPDSVGACVTTRG